ncbi:MAG: hypothetical protein M0R39_03455 [Prolixibacteraceae bacterium]|jgi:hypothetical protein|nr:hypothetical protein [Prolixibacteraceae bacterium]
MENTEADIELRYLLRGSEPVVQLILEYDSKLIRLLKTHTKARWSGSLQCWYIPCSEFHPEKFKRDSRWRGFVIRAFTIYLNA